LAGQVRVIDPFVFSAVAYGVALSSQLMVFTDEAMMLSCKFSRSWADVENAAVLVSCGRTFERAKLASAVVRYC
jgi:hypothetical protein